MLWVWCRADPQQKDLLQEALAAEMAKAARRSGQDVSKGSQVQFKQVTPVHSLEHLQSIVIVVSHVATTRTTNYFSPPGCQASAQHSFCQQ